jgi:hypothetical protein
MVNGDENAAVESKVQAEVERSVILQVSKEVSSPVERSDTTDATQILSAGVVDGSESKSVSIHSFFFMCLFQSVVSHTHSLHSCSIIPLSIFSAWVLASFRSRFAFGTCRIIARDHKRILICQLAFQECIT